MATHQNSRQLVSKRPAAHARPSRPVYSKRTQSSGGSKKAAHYTTDDSEDEQGMATSFLQYCTTCEKQIVVPSNFVLYCSESCRRKDNNKQLPYMFDYSEPSTPFANFSMEDIQFQDIVAPHSPTAPSQRSSIALSELSLDDNVTSSDEKSRQDSEASRYLRQFQSATAAAETSVRPVHPRYSRASTSIGAAPSLSHTPTSSASFPLPYTPSTRPLPPRTPHSSSSASRSTDLVTPFTYATAPSSPPHYSLKSAPISTTSTGNVEGEIMYQKSPISTAPLGNGSLRQLFAGTPRWS